MYSLQATVTMAFFTAGILMSGIVEAQDFQAVKKIELYEENTDADPAKDALKVYVIFGDSNAQDVRPLDGVSFPFKCFIFEYPNDGQQGRQIGYAKGDLKSERGFTSFLVKLPNVKVKTRVLAHVQVTMPNGKVIEGKRSDTFDPNKH